MHKIISLSLLLFIGGTVSPAMAQSTSPDYGMLNRDKTKGPRTPSEDFIVCHYGTGWIDFEFPESVELNGGIVRKGGRLVIRAKDVRMTSGFKVEEGGILKIENN